MAGSDPRSSRAPGAVPDHGNFEAEEDPLIELARIVSEDGGFATPKTEKPKMNRNEATQRSSYADGLEAELLQELENSLGGREAQPVTPPRPASPRQPPAPATSPRASAPPPQPRARVEAEHDPDDLLRSIEEQLGQFERRQAERLAATTADFESAFEPPAAEEREPQAGDDAGIEEERFAALDEEPVPEARPKDRWQSPRVSLLRPLDDDEEEVPSSTEGTWEQPDTLPAPPLRADYRFRGPASADWERPVPENNRTPSPAAQREHLQADEPPIRRIESLPGFGDEESDADLFAPSGRSSRAHDPFVEAEPVREAAAARSAGEAARRRRIADAFPEFEEGPVAQDQEDQDRDEDEEGRAAINARLAQALESDFEELLVRQTMAERRHREHRRAEGRGSGRSRRQPPRRRGPRSGRSA